MNLTSSSTSATPPTEPSAIVRHMHNAPRFGHTSSIALLASRSRDDQLDYARGILGFCVFLWCWFVVWALVLVVLKCCCRVGRVGCAAGGQIVNVQALKAQGYRNTQRKRFIVRSWRIQTTLLLCCVLFFMAMVCGNKMGVLKVVHTVLPSLQQINENIQALAYQGLQIANSIQRASAPLIDIKNRHNLTVLLDNHHHSSNCPLANQLPWPLYQRTIQVGLEDLTVFVNTTVVSAQHGWSQVISATQGLETILFQIAQHVYVARAWMVVSGVFNAFLLMGVVLTLHYVVHPPLSCFLAYLILPAFMVCILAALVALGGLSAILLMDADFCDGGTAPGSAIGTILDIMYRRGMQQNGFAYQTLVYYLNDCVTTSPFASTSSTVKGMENVLETVASWRHSVNATILASLSKSCQRDITQSMTQLDSLSMDLQSVQSGLQSALGLAECQNIFPILRDIAHGPLCTSSVHALTWMWSTMLVMVVLGFIIVSCRAGLYNAIVRAPAKHGQLKYQRREFEEYKRFMAEHYDDADKWKFQPSPQKMGSEENEFGLRPCETFDTTAATSKPSSVGSLSDNEDVPILTVVVHHNDEKEMSQLQDATIGESFELNATMVNEIGNLQDGLDKVVKDLEALDESINRAEKENHHRADVPYSDDDEEVEDGNVLLFKTPVRTHHKTKDPSSLIDVSSSPSLSYMNSTLWPWRSQIFPNDSIVVDDTELKPLTPSVLSAPMAPRKTRPSIQRTRNNHLS